MKKMNKKGFTIVELVIVIAVIAVLAGVMIPTFTGIVAQANLSAVQQRGVNAYKQAYANALLDDGKIDSTDAAETIDGFTFTWGDNGACTVTAPEGYTASVANGVITVEEATDADDDDNADA